MQKLSVIITNYNYADYVGIAIESALALAWDDVEVIVVDDGSTDDSRSVIESYGVRIRPFFSENSTQRVAANTGFAMSSGDAVVFLDADDVLPPDLPGRIDRLMTPSVSNVQFQMQRIDARGVPVGSPMPEFSQVPSSDQIAHWMAETTAYPTPPGSGNAYARWFLERIFPLDDRIGKAADSACIAAAAVLGDVVTDTGTPVGYRRHGGNVSNMASDDKAFLRQVERGRARWRFAQRAAGIAEPEIDERPLRSSRELLQFRVSALRSSGDFGLPEDSRSKMAIDALRSPTRPGPERLVRRLAVSGWSLAMIVAPGPVVRWLLRRRWERMP